MSARKKRVSNMDLQQRRHDRSTAPPNRKKKRDVTPPELREKAAPSILSLSPEVIENILFRLSAMDVISFGSTCCYLHELSLNQAVWKRLYLRNFTGPAQSNDKTNWRRFTILKMSQGLVLQHLNRRLGRIRQHRTRRQRQAVVQTFNSPLALGFRRVVPIRDYILLWDYNGTIFFTPRGSVTQRRPINCSVLCHQSKDFSVDPDLNNSLCQYIYVLMRFDSSSNPLVPVESPGCDIVDVFHWETHQKVFRMTFHPTLCFTQLRLSGSKDRRFLLLLTDDGKVYSMHLNETQFSTLPYYTTVLTLKTVCGQQPELPIRQLHTSPNTIVYITADGSVCVEVHSPGVHRQLFGTHADFNPIGGEMLISLPLPYKVVKCSMGLNHICLLDDCGRIFMQGCNRHGQLGTGDKIDRGEPTLVVVSMAPVDVWCGLNHSVLLLEAECGDKQVQGCGCGSQGRLPGYLEGSHVFVRLNVEVPRTTSSLCSSRKCLYLICSHDITEPPARCYIPPESKDQRDAEKEQEEEIEKLHMHLTQMKRCVGTNRQLMILQRAVSQHMTGLSPAYKAFLDSALAVILNGNRRAIAAPQQQPDA